MTSIRTLFPVLSSMLLLLLPVVSSFSIVASSPAKQRLLRNKTSSSRGTTTQLHSSPFNFLSSLETLFTPTTTFTKNINQSQIQSLKQQLYKACQSNYGKSNPQIRTQIESLIQQLLQLYNPTTSTIPINNTSKSKLLQRKWIVLWTSEKEINFFLENGISNEIVQILSGGDTLENWIPFVKGGGFGVTGIISSSSGGISDDDNGENDNNNNNNRTLFQFTNAKLDLGKWGTYNFPPVGSGWFDTVYLDEELRIDLNSRNDILICRGGE